MVEIRRILHPTDFSTGSHVALQYACRLAESLDAELHLLHVFSKPVPTVPVPGMPFPPADSYLAALERESATALGKLPGVEKPGTVVRVTRQGHPVPEIVQYANEAEIDMIVMGTHGRTGLAHLLIGSVAEKVVKMASCPVVTVHPEQLDRS